MNDSSEEYKCLLAFQLESLHVFEKCSKRCFRQTKLKFINVREISHLCCVCS